VSCASSHPRRQLLGESRRNVDFSVSKNIPVNDRLAAEFRGEFFNVSNSANFASPSRAIASSGFGVIKATEGNPRVIQFALKLLF
jgi:hypothetical protein